MKAYLPANIASLRMTLIFLHLPIFPYALYAWSERGGGERDELPGVVQTGRFRACVSRTSLLDIPLKGAHDMEHAGMPASGAARRAVSLWRPALIGLALLPVLLALACTNTVSLASAPAASLQVSIHFEHALVAGATTRVTVGIFTEPNTYVDQFTGGQTLAIDGVALRPGGSATIPRQAPGGVGFYTFTYTDEHGQQTVMHIPAPQVDFAVLAPTAGSRVLLPRPVGAGRNRTGATPIPTPADPSQPRPPQLADAPLTVRYTLPYPLASVPQDSNDSHRYEVGVGAYAPAWPACPPSVQNRLVVSPVSGTATIDDSSFAWGTGFETRAPGPRHIVASMGLHLHLPAPGFSAFTAFFDGDSVSVPITWV